MTSEVVSQRTAKVPRDSDDDDNQEEGDRRDNDEKATKAKRHDIEVPMAEVDIKLAEKLDNILKISDTRKPRFFMNKPMVAKTVANKGCDNELARTTKSDINDKIPLKHKDFTREQLRQRLTEKYDTLVPELDPKRPTVRLVKILSATESLELAKEQARKQLEHQLELSSVGGNRQAKKDGISKFRFKDGYELPPKCFLPKKHKSVSFASNGHANEVMTSVKYFKPDENEATSSEHDSDDNTDDSDDDSDDDDDDAEDDDDDEDNADNATDESCHLLTVTGKEQVDKVQVNQN